MSKLSKLIRNKRTSANKQQLLAQPLRTAKNKIRKLQKHLKKHPNDVQSKGKLKNG